MPMNRSLYPDNWEQLALDIKTKAGWRCQECGRPCRKPGQTFNNFLHDDWCEVFEKKWPTFEFVDDEELGMIPKPKSQSFVLTVAHLDHNPANNSPDNLKALCTPCHARYDITPSALAIKQRLNLERAGQLSFLKLL